MRRWCAGRAANKTVRPIAADTLSQGPRAHLQATARPSFANFFGFGGMNSSRRAVSCLANPISATCLARLCHGRHRQEQRREERTEKALLSREREVSHTPFCDSSRSLENLLKNL